MPRAISSVLDINNKSRGWTVLIQVIERSNVQTSHGNVPKKMRRFLFTDTQGTKVSAITYDNCIRLFYNLLWPFKRYFISNAVVNEAPVAYRVSQYSYSWIINSTTLVEAHEDPIPPTLPCTFQLTRFADLHRYADTDILQNIKAIVVHVFPQKQQTFDATTRDLVIVNEEKKLMLLTLWNQFDEDEGNQIANTITTVPLIIGMRLKVTTFNALSLTSRLSSSFLLNPPLPDDMNMNEWYNANKEDVKTLFEAKSYKNPSFLLPIPREDDIFTIQKAESAFQTKQQKTAWIRGDTRLMPGQSKFWYISCNNCHKSVNAEVDWKITCPSCKEYTEVQVRCRIVIIISDPTGSLNSLISGEDAEKLIPFTAAKLKEADENGATLETQLAQSISKQTIVCFLRTYDIEYQGQTQNRNSILKAYTMDEFLQVVPPLISHQSSLPSISVATPSAAAEKIVRPNEMFTPTTNLMLQEITAKIDVHHNYASTSGGVKRSLTFEEADQSVTSAAELNLPAAANLSGTEETPSKKHKDSLDNY